MQFRSQWTLGHCVSNVRHRHPSSTPLERPKFLCSIMANLSFRGPNGRIGHSWLYQRRYSFQLATKYSWEIDSNERLHLYLDMVESRLLHKLPLKGITFCGILTSLFGNKAEIRDDYGATRLAESNMNGYNLVVVGQDWNGHRHFWFYIQPGSQTYGLKRWAVGKVNMMMIRYRNGNEDGSCFKVNGMEEAQIRFSIRSRQEHLVYI